jgi:AAA ATPase-like protein
MIDGFAIAGYRSFGPTPVRVRDLDQVNVFIGPNNCGKSNILRFVRLLGASLRPDGYNQQSAKLDPMLDLCFSGAGAEVQYELQAKKDGNTDHVFRAIAEPFGSSWTATFPDCSGSAWFGFLLSNAHPTADSLQHYTSQLLTKHNLHALSVLLHKVCKKDGGSSNAQADAISEFIHDKMHIHFDVRFVDAFRQITVAEEDSLSGPGLIQKLRKLKSPELTDYDSAKARFRRIEGFLQTVLEQPAAELDIPAEKDEIYVRLDKKRLPLKSLGTGIHQLIILAAAVTLVDDAVFCIEEPEIHLHPELQKKFIHYITENTNNQYLITSHSNAFFDMPGVNIYRCWLESGLTQCELATDARDKHSLLMELGYRPSDLLLANCVIWVEGPSDKIYINHWLNDEAPDLVEGLHYSVMFYGGSLLSHLTYDSESCADEFIRLCRLNRNACIVIDSDKDDSDSPINDTKMRVKSGFAENDRFVWVTAGRTIENYVTEDLLNVAIKQVHPQKGKPIVWKQFADLSRMDEDSRFDKVSIARHVAQAEADFSKLGLAEKIGSLVEEIRKCNGSHALHEQ